MNRVGMGILQMVLILETAQNPKTPKPQNPISKNYFKIRVKSN